MKQKILFLTMILCLMLAGVPAWAGGVVDVDTSSAAQATAISGQGGQGGTAVGIGQGGQGGTGVGYGGSAGAQAVTGPSSANVGNVSTGPSSAASTVGDVTSGSSVGDVSSGSSSRVGDISATIGNVQTGPSSASVEGVDGGDVTLTQTFEAAETPDLWKQKGPAVLPGIPGVPTFQKFVNETPVGVQQAISFDNLIRNFGLEYSGEFQCQKKRGKSKKTDIYFIPHPRYLNYLNNTDSKIRVKKVRIVFSLSGRYICIGMIGAIPRKSDVFAPLLTGDAVNYVQNRLKGFNEIILLDDPSGRGFVSGVGGNGLNGGLSGGVSNFSLFNTISGGLGLSGGKGESITVGKVVKNFWVVAPDIMGTEVQYPRNSQKRIMQAPGGGNGKKAVGSGVVK